MIFIDRSIPEAVAKALKCVRDDVIWLDDILPHVTRDEDWIEYVAQNDYLAITRDKQIRYRPGEKQRWLEAGAGVFIVSQSKNPTKWEYLQLLTKSIDQMEELFESTPKPFGYAINRQGGLRKIFP